MESKFLLEDFGWNESIEPCCRDESLDVPSTSPGVAEELITCEEADTELPVKKGRGRPSAYENQERRRTRIGQCGNQIGQELFSLAFKDTVSSTSTHCRNVWFRHSGTGQLTARAVLVDSETKVMKQNTQWNFQASNIVNSQSGGAGNNFAFGYCVIGPQLQDAVLERLRQECEKCDRVQGIVGLGSCAGGLGSGAGTHLLENIRDTYPHKNILSVLVTPHATGETVTQNSNTLFTLAKQTQICDALVVFENDLISNLLMYQLRLKNTTIIDMNKIISYNLLSFLQPIKEGTRILDLHDYLTFLCPQPSYKLLTIHTFPLIKESRSKFDGDPSWNATERDMTRNLKTSVDSSNRVDLIDSVANLVISRGQVVPNSAITKLKSVLLSPDLIPSSRTFRHYHQSRQFLCQDKCLTLESGRARKCPDLMTYGVTNKVKCLWSKKDKINFLKGLEEFGPNDLKGLQTYLPNKTESEIRCQIRMWSEFARIDLQKKLSVQTVGKKKRGNGCLKVIKKLKEWTDHFEDMNIVDNSRLNALSNVFLLIAEYGKFSPPSELNNIDLRAMYRYVHCMLNGTPYHGLNKETAAMLSDSIADLLALLKERNCLKELQPHLFSLPITDRPLRTYNSHCNQKTTSMSKNPEDMLKHQDFNPLNIRPSVLTKKYIELYEDDEDYTNMDVLRQ